MFQKIRKSDSSVLIGSYFFVCLKRVTRTVRSVNVNINISLIIHFEYTALTFHQSPSPNLIEYLMQAIDINIFRK
jgi:hypothetical protein